MNSDIVTCSCGGRRHRARIVAPWTHTARVAYPPVAGSAHSHTPVCIIVPHEDALIHRPDTGDDLSADYLARPQNPAGINTTVRALPPRPMLSAECTRPAGSSLVHNVGKRNAQTCGVPSGW